MKKLLPWLLIVCLAAAGCAGKAAAPGVGMRQKAVALNDSGWRYYQEGQSRLALHKFEQALRVNRLIDHPEGMAANLNNLGVVHLEQGDLEQAQACFTEALDLMQGQGNPAGLAETLNNLGSLYLSQGYVAEAQETFTQALGWARMLPPGPLLALSLTHLGDAARAQGDASGALALYRQALEIDEAGKDQQGRAVHLERMGRAFMALEEYPQARQHLTQSLEESRRLEYTRGIIAALEGLVQLSLAQGDQAGVQAYGERLLKIYQALGRTGDAKRLAELLQK